MLPSIDIYKVIVLVAIFMIALLSLRRSAPGSKSFFLFSLLLTGFYLFDILYQGRATKNVPLFIFLAYNSYSIIATTLLFFVAEFLDNKFWNKKRYWLIFAIEPITLAWLTTQFPDNIQPFPNFSEISNLQHALWDIVHPVYFIVVLVSASVLIAPYLTRKILGDHRPVGWLIFLALNIPIARFVLQLDAELRIYNLIMHTFMLGGILLSIVLLTKNIQTYPFLTRKHIVDKMNTGWLVVDLNNLVIDINPAAERVLATSKKEVYKTNVDDVFHKKGYFSKLHQSQERFETSFSMLVHKKNRYLTISNFPIHNQKGILSAYLLLVQDRTESRKAENARQEARDEMFSLLHSISNSASQASNIEEFLNASMYQLSYTFKSDAAAIFLLDQDLHKQENLLLLVAHHGISSKKIGEIPFINLNDEGVTVFTQNDGTALLLNAGEDSHAPAFLRDTFDGHMILVPILADGELIGLLIMSRINAFYRKDDGTRLEIATQKIGNFVQNDHRRYVANTLAERKRLVRDLHDTVTQRLYGLAMLTETARMQIESGKTDKPSELLTEIADNTRQAIKEMRLFLYKLQPVDIERQGFISSILHRLEAVEGRGGLTTELDIDHELVLSIEEELHLFLIAQEALNNIIKHASATKIKIIFNKQDENTHLVISDNGKGFDAKKIDNAGMGLINIRDRAKIINAKVSFISAPNKGTTVAVVFRPLLERQPEPGGNSWKP